MGGCCSAHEKDGITLVGYVATVEKRNKRLDEANRQILRVKARVMYLSFVDNGESSGQWMPYIKTSVFVLLHCVKESDASYVYQVSATSLDGVEFASLIEVPRMRLRKISDTFVFWKDDIQEKVFGLSFGSESDTLRFIAGCTPVTMNSKSLHITNLKGGSLLEAPQPTPATTQDSNQSPKQVHQDIHKLRPQYTVENHSQPSVNMNGGNQMSMASFQDRPSDSANPIPETAAEDTGNNGSILTNDGNTTSTNDLHISTDDGLASTDGGNISTDSRHIISTEGGHTSTEGGHISTDDGIASTDDRHIKADGRHFATDDGHGTLEEGSSSGSICSCENMVTNIDDMTSEEEGDDDLEAVEPSQEANLQWQSPSTDPTLNYSFILHDIPEVTEEEEEEKSSPSSSQRDTSSDSKAKPVRPPSLKISPSPPSFPTSPVPGDLLSPHGNTSDVSTPRHTVLFEKYPTLESPIHEFDEILREFSKSISLDEIISEMDAQTAQQSHQSAINGINESSYRYEQVHATANGYNHESPDSRQDEFSHKKKSKLKLSKSLDYLSEAEIFFQQFTKDLDEGEALTADQKVLASANDLVNIHVVLPTGRNIEVSFSKTTSIEELLFDVCEPYHFVPDEHFVVLVTNKEGSSQSFSLPSDSEVIGNLEFSCVEIWEKDICTVYLQQKQIAMENFGLSLEPIFTEDKSILLSAIVLEIQLGGPAHMQGLMVSDEIVLINDIAIFELTWRQVQDLLKNETEISLTFRSKRTRIDSTGCHSGRRRRRPRSCTEDYMQNVSEEVLEAYLKEDDDIPDVTGVKSPKETYSPQRQKMLEKLHKTISDLLQTEKDLTKHFNEVIDACYRQLKERDVPNEELLSLFSGFKDAKLFQKRLLQDLETVTSSIAELHHYSNVQNLIGGIASVFIHHTANFKVYAAFCTNHCRLRNILAPSDKPSELKALLETCPISEQLHFGLEIVFTKPIQRVLQYPLYLHVLLKQLPQDSQEKRDIQDAIAKMESTVNYINEMQRISDNCTQIFDTILREANQWKLNPCVNVGQLKHYETITWLNPHEELAKGLHKGEGPDLNFYVFIGVIVFFVTDRRRRRPSRSMATTPPFSIQDVQYKAALLRNTSVARDLPDSDGVTNMWQIYGAQLGDSKACHFLLRSQSAEQKYQILRVLNNY